MDKAWGKTANSLRKLPGITSVRVSPGSRARRFFMALLSAKLLLIHEVFHTSPQALSTIFSSFSPLTEHNFYPVSTATYYKHHQRKI
jgi:hypothetical protein